MTGDPLAAIRRHAANMTPAELASIRAAAIIRGDDAATVAALAHAPAASRAAWDAIARTLQRAHTLCVHWADVLPLADRAAMLAALAEVRGGMLAGAPPHPGGLAAAARAEHAERSAAAALTLAGIRAWCLEATGADALDLLAAMSADSLSDPAERAAAELAPDALDAAGVRAWWQGARPILERAAADHPPDVTAAALEAERWRMMAASA